ncbi:hypothetical protein IAE29_23200 [Ochrobactrum sp. S46]|nr:hypothetical protein [Ochrobactrum sp. S45]MBK0046233.1 hypothetical protein [Ochrobactrum sp. S46]
MLALTVLTERHPSFIDGHAHLDYGQLEQGKSEQALRAAHAGYSIATSAIPSQFSGPIDWGWIESRPFLRPAHALALCEKELGHHMDAIKVMEQLLVWNPHNNQGLRSCSARNISDLEAS